VLRGAALSLAYVPGRALEYGSALDFTATRMRDTISPAVQFAVLLAVVLWWRQPDRPELFPFRRPKPTAEPPPVPPPKVVTKVAPATPKPPAVTGSRSRSPGLSGSRRR
jgi:alpha-1,6-mannosyltransferase